MPARFAIRLTVTSRDPAAPISAIVASTKALRRIGSIPSFGITPPNYPIPNVIIFIDPSIKKKSAFSACT
jgi:hypothetical protein